MNFLRWSDGSWKLFLILAFVAMSHEAPTVSNGTLEQGLGKLFMCSKNAHDVDKIEKWMNSVHRYINENHTDPSHICEEKWLTCLLGVSEAISKDSFVFRLLIKHLNLCSDASVDESATESTVSLQNIFLVVIALLFNVIAVSSGFCNYIYRSDCRLRLRNDAKQ